jgi:hypothetical protein
MYVLYIILVLKGTIIIYNMYKEGPICWYDGLSCKLND